MLFFGAGLLVLGVFQQDASLSILGVAFWIAALLGLGILLLQRMNAIKRIATSSHDAMMNTAQVEAKQKAPRPREPIYAGMASIPGRVRTLEQAVSSIYDQVDGLFIYLNNYDEIPPFLQRDKIAVFTSQLLGDIKDSGKFFGLTQVRRGIYLSLDDDIQYPPDYAKFMANQLARFRKKCVVGVHGIFFPTLVNSFFDRRAIHFERKWDVTAPVSVLGTGTVAFSIEHSGITFDIFKQHGMADVSLALFMKKRRIPPLVVRRDGGWLRGLSIDDDSTLYRSTLVDSIEHTAAIVAARPWGLSELGRRIEHAGIAELLPRRWHAVMAAYRGTDDAAAKLGKYPLATLLGLIQTLLNNCEAWEIARLIEPTRPKDIQLHCNLLQTCLSYYPEEVLDLCLKTYSRYKEQRMLEGMMAYASIYLAGLRKLSMYEQADALYRELDACGELSPNLVMEFVRLKWQEGDYERVISLARDRYVDLSHYGDFVPIAYGAVAHVRGLYAGLHGFMPSFFANGRQASRRRRTIIATCKQVRLTGLDDLLEFDLSSAETAAVRRGSARCFLDLVLLYSVLDESKRARRLLEQNTQLVERWYGSPMRALLYAVTAKDRHDSLRYLNEYNKCFELVPVILSEPEDDQAEFFPSLSSVTALAIPEDKGKISVVMAAFNAAETIRYSVESILAQSYRNIEVIVVDDASTDGTWKELEKLQRSDDRVKPIRSDINAGPYVCRNVALEVAGGVFIAIHDADDFAHPQRLERQMAVFEREIVVAVFATHIRFNRYGLIELENNGSIVGHGPVTLLCRRSVFEEIGEFEPVRTRGDIEFRDRMKCYYGTHRLANLDEVLVYALHDSASNSHAMMQSPEARRKLELFRADYNRRLMLVQGVEHLGVVAVSEGAGARTNYGAGSSLPLQPAS